MIVWTFSAAFTTPVLQANVCFSAHFVFVYNRNKDVVVLTLRRKMLAKIPQIFISSSVFIHTDLGQIVQFNKALL